MRARERDALLTWGEMGALIGRDRDTELHASLKICDVSTALTRCSLSPPADCAEQVGSNMPQHRETDLLICTVCSVCSRPNMHFVCVHIDRGAFVERFCNECL